MLVFGFDIGTTSIGFAAIEQNEARTEGRIIRLGARIFPEARDPDGTPLNQQRRAKRMVRRQLRRRRKRRRALNELLGEYGLLPKFDSPEWARAMAMDPYALRDRGLDAALAPHELGRALYHLAKRRHFKARDAAEEGADEKKEQTPDEAAEEKTRVSDLDALRKSGKTLGRWLARLPEAKRKRGKHVTRAEVEDEFTQLIDAQKPHHPALADGSLGAALQETIFFQRPVFWRESTLGSCPLFPGAPPCPKGSWLSQQRRMLEKVNNLALAGGNARPLDAEERAAILAVLQTQKAMTWPSVRNALKAIARARGEGERSLKFNLEYGDDKVKGGLKGNVVEADLAKIFGARWAKHPHKQVLRNIVPGELWNADYGAIGSQRVVIRSGPDRAARRAAFADRLVGEYAVLPEQAEAIAKLHFPQGWEPFSSKALELMLPELERGVKFGEMTHSLKPEWIAWRDRNFPDRDRPTGEILDKLPSPRADRHATPEQKAEAQRIANLRNPTVVRAQNELRKVVNNLIREYGKPDLIRLELARDVGKSKREREEISLALRRRERERDKARKDLQENGLDPDKHRNVEKCLLWQECGKQCPYTGAPISFDALFREGAFQIEHIWPRSRSLDDSFRNKTLCEVAFNKNKGNRLPFDYFKTLPPDAWDAAKRRVDKLVAEKCWSVGKGKRFLAEKLDDDFKNHQLTDTSYAARQARAFLQRLWADEGPTGSVNAQTVNGRMTAELRKRWGLNHILADDGEKNREDHRHHAIDALVVACADSRYPQQLSDYFKQDGDYRRGFGPKPKDTIVEPPWPMIRDDAKRACDETIVSHRVRKKVSGPLHLETTYGDTKIDETTKSGTYRRFVTRKPLERLSKSELADIVDDRVRNIVGEWVAENGGDPKKAFANGKPIIGGEEKGHKIEKVRLHTKQQLSLMAPVSTGYADLGSNHHVAIYRGADGKIFSRVVSLFEALRRIAAREPIVRRDPGDGASFLMSLTPGEALHIPSGKLAGHWIVQGAWAAGPIVILRAHDAKGASVTRPIAASLIREGARKISIDPIGRVRPAND